MVLRRYSRFGWLALSLVAARPAHAQCPGPCLTAVRALKLDSLPAPVQTYYSADFQARAMETQALLREAEQFFADSLNLQPGIRLALLDAADWKRVNDRPYGLPHVDAERLAFLPATDDGVITMDFLRLEKTVSDTVRAKIVREGVSFAQFARHATDVIALHELGHTYVRLYGINPRARWFNEFLASYFAIAFLQHTHPSQVRLSEALAEATLEQQPPAYTSLQDFEQFYGATMSPNNINWYQTFFLKQVIEVSRDKGLAFLKIVRDAFPPAESDSVSVGDVLDRLERIHPGFHAWAGQRGQ